MLIPLTSAMNIWRTFPSETKHLTCLRSSRNVQLNFSVYSWDFYFIPQCDLCECERQFTVNIVTFTCVVVMWHDLNNNIKISWRSTVHTLFPFTANTNLLTVVNTCWNINFYLCILFDTARTMTCLTFVSNNFTCSATVITNTSIDNLAKGCVLLNV